jgi:hypothetical protein
MNLSSARRAPLGFWASLIAGEGILIRPSDLVYKMVGLARSAAAESGVALVAFFA